VKHPAVPPIRIHPSILNADFADLAGAVRAVERGGGDAVHVDVMDGHFVPNLSMGPQVVRSLARRTRLPLDVHLMIEDPSRFIGPFLEAGAAGITVHAEARGRTATLLDRIRAAGGRAAVALRPRTPLAAIEGLLRRLDMVLLMTVEPGFGGQAFREDVLPKIRALREAARRRGRALDIQVDGGVTERTVRLATAAGANVIVAGVAVFGARSPEAAIRRIRAAAEAAAG
jgi:ribulose-phosphate 3-epimerase